MAEKKTKPTAKKVTATKTAVKKTVAKKAAPKKRADEKNTDTAKKKGKLVEIKTKESTASVTDFINSVKDEQQRKDSITILEIMRKATKEEPKMWGSSIIGFGNMRYKSPNTGREVDWMKIGFSPRKANISLYLTISIKEQQTALQKLGKHKTGVGCLYINKLADVDMKVLKAMIEEAVKRK